MAKESTTNVENLYVLSSVLNRVHPLDLGSVPRKMPNSPTLELFAHMPETHFPNYGGLILDKS